MIKRLLSRKLLVTIGTMIVGGATEPLYAVVSGVVYTVIQGIVDAVKKEVPQNHLEDIKHIAQTVQNLQVQLQGDGK
jgi:hypothetical protein